MGMFPSMERSSLTSIPFYRLQHGRITLELILFCFDRIVTTVCVTLHYYRVISMHTGSLCHSFFCLNKNIILFYNPSDSAR